MKPSYADELEHLVSSYAWAAREDISPLAELLDIVVSGTALYIGSGGALAVSALASALHVAKTGRLATHATPLAVSRGPLRHSTAAVLSARAGHPDVSLAARAVVRQGCDPIGLVTHRRVDEIPSSLASQPITIVSYAAPFARDGFLATNTVLTMSTLVVLHCTLNQSTKDWYTARVTLNGAQGLVVMRDASPTAQHDRRGVVARAVSMSCGSI